MRQVIDPVEDYLKLLRKIYDFGALRKLLARKDFRFTFDGMHGVAGPYALRIFTQARSAAHLAQDGLIAQRLRKAASIPIPVACWPMLTSSGPSHPVVCAHQCAAPVLKTTRCKVKIIRHTP